jgi:peptidoglycan/LPS O-acetylase OafA/YrhL
MSECFKTIPPLAIIGLLASSGGMAVDIFFVLSGFLISYILLKEHKKTGKIDMWAFYRGRFLRLWPVMLVWAVFYTLVNIALSPLSAKDFWTYAVTLTFTNNWFGMGA